MLSIRQYCTSQCLCKHTVSRTTLRKNTHDGDHFGLAVAGHFISIASNNIILFLNMLCVTFLSFIYYVLILILLYFEFLLKLLSVTSKLAFDDVFWSLSHPSYMQLILR